jgi:hypothetical protein
MASEKKAKPKAAAKTYRLGKVVPNQIQLLLDNRRIAEQEFAQADVVTLWQKAVASAKDAKLQDLSVDSAIRLAYDAGHLAALALLAAHGLKTSSGQGHHEMAFHAAAGLGGEPLDDLVADSEEIRGLRKGSMYDPALAGEAERKLSVAWVNRTLPSIRAALVNADQTLDQRLAPCP